MRPELFDERLPARFWDKVSPEPNSGCWLWTGCIRKNDGYANFGPRSYVTALAHRYAYITLIGPIPDGLQLDHLCRVRCCVNPNHLEPVTKEENQRRVLRTHCVHGHEFTPENTYTWHRRGLPRRTSRTCRACNRRIHAERKQRRAAQGRAA